VKVSGILNKIYQLILHNNTLESFVQAA